MAFVGFDTLHVSGQDVMREPWRDRRKRLEDVVAGAAMPGVTIVPTTMDGGVFEEIIALRAIAHQTASLHGWL